MEIVRPIFPTDDADLDLAIAGEAVFEVTCDKPRRPTNRS